MAQQISPYRLFKDWLLNPYPNAKLEEAVIRAINPKTVLHMFGNMGGITIFLDDIFNNFDLMSCNPVEFYSFLKGIVQKHSIKKYDFSFFYSMKKDEQIIKLQKMLPHMKKYEIYDLLEYCKDDTDNESFLENLGLNKLKSKKVKTKKSNKDAKKDIPKEAKTFDNMGMQNIRTWEDWKNCFNLSSES